MKLDFSSENKSKRRIIRFSFLALGAVLTGFTVVFSKIGILEWISLVPSAVAFIKISEDENVRKRGLYGYGFFFFMCFYLVNYHWFINLYPLDFVSGMTKAAAVAVVLSGWIGLSLLQASMGALVFLIFGMCIRTSVVKRSAPVGALLAAALWAIFEWTQTLGWVGVPWGRLSIGQTEWLIGAQTASLFGACFVTFMIVAVNFFAAYSILSVSKRSFFAITAAALFVFNTVVGSFIYMTDKDDGETLDISVIQGNISSQEKWNTTLTQKTLDIYEKYTKEAANNGAEIVVWPESSLPFNIDSYISLQNYAKRLARENNVTILVGAFTTNQDGEECNSIIAFLPDETISENVYSKRHLVPFGEFVPMRSVFEILIPPLTEISMLSYDLTPGEDSNVFYFDEGNIGSLICFDSIYDELARDSVADGAQVLAISTNDSWFLDSAALYMHNAQAKLRAIENDRYVVRAANTGISSVINSRGEELFSLEPLSEGEITTTVYLEDSRTLYNYIGNTFVYLCIVLVIFLEIYETISSRYFNKTIDKFRRK